MGLLFVRTTTEHRPGEPAVEPDPVHTVPSPASGGRPPPHMSSPPPPPPPPAVVEATCWWCLSGPVVPDPASGALLCTLCGLAHDAGDAEFVRYSEFADVRGASLVHHGSQMELEFVTTEELGVGPAVESNPVHTVPSPASGRRPPHLPSSPPPAVVEATEELKTYRSCLAGPVVPDPDSGALVCTSCGLVHDAGDAEFVHRFDFTAGSFVDHGSQSPLPQEAAEEEMEEEEEEAEEENEGK